MIKSVNTLAKELEDKLNQNATGLSVDFENTAFEFAIFAETGKYKKPTRSGNTVTYYINGIMKMGPSQIEGTAEDNINTSISTTVELLVPVLNSYQGGELDVVGRVRDLIDNTLGYNSASSEKKIGKVDYFVGIEYQIAQTGTREILEQVGDCVRMTLSIDYYFIAKGVSSNDIKISIDEKTVHYTNIGISRRTITEGNICNDGNGCVSKAATFGTVLVINMSMPLRKTEADDLFINYTLGKENGVEKHDVGVTIGKNPVTCYVMSFSSCHLNGEIGLNASVSVELVEVF